MEQIINLLPVLMVAITMNLAAGIYYNVGKNQNDFSIRKLINGIIKAAIIGFMFIGSAYCFDQIALSSLGVTPELIMNSAITLYVGKALLRLSKILGIKTENEDNAKKIITSIETNNVFEHLNNESLNKQDNVQDNT